MCHERNIPILVNNARMSKKSARGYAALSYLSRHMFLNLNIAAISTADAKRFEFLGVPKNNIQVTGSIKYDLTLPSDFEENKKKIDKFLGDKKIFVAASTHSGEEELILKAYQKLKLKYDDLILFLVPRHPNRADSIVTMALDMQFKAILRSDLEDIAENTNVIVGNTIGEMLLFYSIANIVFVGGSLIPHGGHNPLEAAIFGKAIITGEHVFNFHEMYKLFNKKHGCVITNSDRLYEDLDKVLSNDQLKEKLELRSKSIFEDNGGALQRQMNLVSKWL